MNKRTKNNLMIISLCAAFVALSVFASAASTSLLKPGQSRITAGSSFEFTLDLSDVIDKAEKNKEEGDVLNGFDVSLTVSPAVSAFSVAEGVGHVNPTTGEYQVSSSELGDKNSLNFTVTPAGDISKDTTYTVSVDITGLGDKLSDSFSFVVTAVKTEKPDSAGSKQGMKMSGKAKAGGSMSSGGGGAGTASVVYAGSWDNYLDALSVDGFEFTRKFSKIRDTYFVTVPLDTTELTVNATASDSSAVVAVTGNTDLPEGRSKIMVSVTADDGSVRVYRIYVDRTDEKEEETAIDEKGKSGMPEGFTPPDGAGKKGRPKANTTEGSDEG